MKVILFSACLLQLAIANRLLQDTTTDVVDKVSKEADKVVDAVKDGANTVAMTFNE